MVRLPPSFPVRGDRGCTKTQSDDPDRGGDCLGDTSRGGRMPTLSMSPGDTPMSALPAEELFAKARSSVWIVLATTLTSQSAASSHVSQGSAVAITHSHLLTNYHVVDGRRLIVVKQGDQVLEATVVASDKESDRCVLAVTGEALSPADGLRSFEELRVGEKVYAIGSPSAMESTLGQGIVSGLRTVAGRHLVQTTAPISPGSSGGGLFDSAGNLVGITSFMLKNSQGLNFAIAAEDYFR